MSNQNICKKITFLWLFVFFFILDAIAEANVAIGGAFLMAIPMLSLFSSGGLSLLLVVLLEMFIIHKRLDLRIAESLKISALANLFSTLIGIGIGLAYSSSTGFFIFWIPISVILCFCFLSFCRNMGNAQTSALKKILFFSLFLGTGFIGSFLGTLLLPLTSDFYKSNALMPNPVAVTVSVTVLLILGYIITIITEGYVIARKYPQHTGNAGRISSTIFVMNLCSYIALLPIWGLHLWEIYFNAVF